MAIVEPFQGIRYNTDKVGDLSEVVCPPYDVISQSEQESYYGRRPYNIIRLILGKDLPGDDSQNNKYSRAAAHFRQWLEEGILVKEERPAFYVCEDCFVSRAGTTTDSGVAREQGGRRELRRRSLIARVKLEEWGEGGIYPHEETMPGPKQDRLRLMRACKANLSSILTLYPDEGGRVAELLDAHTPGRPIANACDAGIRSTLWRLDDPDVIGQIRTLMADRPLFIADGHHRYETALDYMKETAHARAAESGASFVMMTCVSMDDPGLEILPTHRLVRGVSQKHIETLRQTLNEYFEIICVPQHCDERTPILDHLLTEMQRLSTERQTPDAERPECDANAPVFGVYCGRQSDASPYFILRLKPSTRIEDIAGRAPGVAGPSAKPPSLEWRRLDVNILHSLILPMTFGIPPSASIGDESIAYTRDPQFIVESVDTGDYQVGFFLNATRVSDLRRVAIRCEKMPPKSTYFYPKLLSGLVINQLNEE